MVKQGNHNNRESPKTYDVLKMLAGGVFLASMFLFPGAGLGLAAIYKLFKDNDREDDYQSWMKYDTARLKYMLHRMQKQKYVTVVEENGISVVKISQKGKTRVLRGEISNIELRKPRAWDGKWRIIIYDISKFKKTNQEAFRRVLKKLHLIQLQKSVYLSPYPCDKEIEFIKQYFDVGDEVIYIRADRIENDELYRDYFGL